MFARKIVSIFFLTCTIIYIVVPTLTFAQTSGSVQGAATLGVARLVETKQKNIKDGSIMSSSQQGAVLSTLAYDPQVLGVVSRDAGIIVNTNNLPNSVPVISDGTVYILVSSKNGNIKKGDLLTTSTIPGVAVKATNAGYVLGNALEDYSNPNPKAIDKIVVGLNLHYFNSKPTILGSLSDILKLALLPTKDSPTALFKYIVAAIVVMGSFVLGFVSFGRTAAKGVEALGRNPAAGKIISLGIIFNVGIVIAIVLAGLTVAFLILRL